MNNHVSILVAVYNGADFLQKMLDSLAAQTCMDFKLVIVDDCSTDATPQILAEEKRFNLQVVRNTENLGLTRSLNVGLAHCDTEWIMRMDADDLCEPERVASQLAFAADHPDLVLFSSPMTIIDQSGHEIGIYALPTKEAEIRFDFLFANPFAHPSACFKRHALNLAGGYYNSEFRTCQDYELWSRLLVQGPVGNQPKCLVRYRRHSGTVNALRAEEQRAAIDLARFTYGRSEAVALISGDHDWDQGLGIFMRGAAPPGDIGDALVNSSYQQLCQMSKSWGLPIRSELFQRRWWMLCKSQQHWGKKQRLRAGSMLGITGLLKSWIADRFGIGKQQKCSVGWPFIGSAHK